MNAHIPGPWSATLEEPRFVIECGGEVGRKALAVTAGSYPSHEGNARLIAAAPDLLAALVNAANVLAGIATGDLKTIGKDSPALQQARAAIARATN